MIEACWTNAWTVVPSHSLYATPMRFERTMRPPTSSETPDAPASSRSDQLPASRFWSFVPNCHSSKVSVSWNLYEINAAVVLSPKATQEPFHKFVSEANTFQNFHQPACSPKSTPAGGSFMSVTRSAGARTTVLALSLSHGITRALRHEQTPSETG